MQFFYYFNFEGNYDILKAKRPCFFSKNKKKLERKNPTQTFRQKNLKFSSCKNQIKSKTVMIWGSQKERLFFAPFILSKENVFNI